MYSAMSKDDILMVTNKLQQPIRSKLFNHKHFVRSFDINSFIQNGIILQCHCGSLPLLGPRNGDTS